MSDLDQAMKLVAAALDNVDRNEYPIIWKSLNEVWEEMDTEQEWGQADS